MLGERSHVRCSGLLEDETAWASLGIYESILYGGKDLLFNELGKMLSRKLLVLPLFFFLDLIVGVFCIL